MIPVALQPEPDDFKALVREPSSVPLDEYKKGKRKKLPALWTRCIPQMRQLYKSVCSYSAVYISPLESASVDHFIPKSVNPDRAYDWDNYRLSFSRLNSRKKDFQDVLDPCNIKPGWFVLNLTTMKISSADNKDVPKREIQATINRLKLDDRMCRNAREMYYNLYVKGMAFADLQKLSPFVAFEVERQGLKRAE